MTVMATRPRRSDTVQIDGHRLRGLREARGLIQAELAARAAPLARGYISEIESTASARVGRDLAERLALALEVAVPDLEPSGAAHAVPRAVSAYAAPLAVTLPRDRLVEALVDRLDSATELLRDAGEELDAARAMLRTLLASDESTAQHDGGS